MKASRSVPPVLVVDDHTAFASTLVQLLETAGQPAMAAASGFDALESVDEVRKLGLVVVDVRMPDLDGCDFVRAMGYLYPQVRCVLMSAYDVDTGLVPRGTPVLAKPFELEELLALIPQPPH
jgi:CheY-like chemotaxis protein